MARKKVTIEDLREVFEASKPYIGEHAELMPMSEDNGKCVLVRGDQCQVFSCSALKGHLEFVIASVPDQA